MRTQADLEFVATARRAMIDMLEAAVVSLSAALGALRNRDRAAFEATAAKGVALARATVETTCRHAAQLFGEAADD